MSRKTFWLAALAVLIAAPAHAATQDASCPAPTHDTRAVVAGINAFSLDLYHAAREPGKNLFLSPASISTAVGLAYRGAGGVTAEDMRKTLHFPTPPADYLRASTDLRQCLNFDRDDRRLATANAIWIDNSVTLEAEYQADMIAHADAGIRKADFRHSHDSARETINRWVEEQTNDKIKGLLAPPDVSKTTRAILVNTIYWKGSWATAFSSIATRPAPFHALDGKQVETPLMNQRAFFRVLEQQGVKAILLPYKGGEVDMAVFLPDSHQGLPQFEAGLDSQALATWFAGLDAAGPRDTQLALPKMHLEWKANVAPLLGQMGMASALGFGADFSGMMRSEAGEGFAIDAVIHQSHLDVDEEGSEAAAATAITMIGATARSEPPPPPFIFRADRPFFFALRDRRTGLILFIGRFAQP